MPSPDPAATPEYYRDQQYRAWFRFSRIDEEPLDPTLLNELTPVRVDEFFSSGESTYGDFYAKVIYSPAELRQQDRTIWFVRAAVTGDKRHEIRLLGAKKVAPSHFARDPIDAASSLLVWVSDPHFSEDHHAFPLKTDAAASELAGALERDLQRLGLSSVAGMVISGDLTWRATDEEFALASEFIRQTRSWSRLEPYQYVVVPGNHDLAFSESPDEKGRPVEVATDQARTAYEHFYRDTYFLDPNPYLSLGRRYLLARAIPVEVVGLNSSFLQQDAEMFQGHGFLGEDQLSDAATQMGWNDSREVVPFRIAVLHHHVVPVVHREPPVAGHVYSLVLDAGALLRWSARYRVSLILHGHMHQPAVTRLALPIQTGGRIRDWHRLTVAGMGSSGAARDLLGDVGRNVIGLLRFGQDSVDVSIQHIDPTRPAEPADEPVLAFTMPYAAPPQR